MENKITAADVEAATSASIEASLQPEGKYTLRVISPKINVKKSASGNFYVTLYMGTVENEAGEKAYSEVLSYRALFTGTNKKGEANHNQFIKLFKALGFGTEAVVEIHSDLLEQIKTLSGEAQTGVTLKLSGQPLNEDIKGRMVEGKVIIEEPNDYHAEPVNKITSVWAVK